MACTYPGLLEKGLSRSLAIGEAGLSQQLHIDKRGGGEHDGMVEQQAHLAIEAIAAVDNVEEGVQVHQWHVGMDKLGVSLKQRILKRDRRQRQGALCLEIANIFGGNLAGQRAQERRQLASSRVGGQIGQRMAQLLGGPNIAKEAGRVNAGVGPGEIGRGAGAIVGLNN